MNLAGYFVNALLPPTPLIPNPILHAANTYSEHSLQIFQQIFCTSDELCFERYA